MLLVAAIVFDVIQGRERGLYRRDMRAVTTGEILDGRSLARAISPA